MYIITVNFIIENFLLSIKYGLAALLFCPLSASEQEVWYNSKGKPTLTKDKITGRMRVIMPEELATFSKKETKAVIPAAVDKEIDLEANESVVETTSRPNSSFILLSSTVADQNSAIPVLLASKIYADNKYYINRNHHYISRPMILRFSNSGYYGFSQYFRPEHNYNYYGNNHYHKKYNRNCGNGFLLRYSRPDLSIHARF